MVELGLQMVALVVPVALVALEEQEPRPALVALVVLAAILVKMIVVAELVAEVAVEVVVRLLLEQPERWALMEPTTPVVRVAVVVQAVP